MLSIQKLEAASHAAEMKSSAAAAKIAELEARVAMSDKLVDERTSLVAYLGKGSSDLVAQVSKLAESIKRSSGRPSINNSSTHVSSLQESLTVAMLASDPMVS